MSGYKYKGEFAVLGGNIISLPKDEEVTVWSKSSYGLLTFFSTAINTSSHNLKLIIDSETVFDLDFSVFQDVFYTNKDTTASPFSIEVKKGEYVFNFRPNEPIEFDSIAIKITNYGNGNKRLDNALITWKEQK